MKKTVLDSVLNPLYSLFCSLSLDSTLGGNQLLWSPQEGSLEPVKPEKALGKMLIPPSLLCLGSQELR